VQLFISWKKKHTQKKNLSEDTSWTYCHGMVEQDEDTKAG